MKSILREQRKSSILAAAVTILLGLVLIFWPDRSVNLMCLLLGAALLVTGLMYILGWFARRRQGGFPAWFLIPGVILSALGLWLLNSPTSVIALIQYVFGAVLLFHGVIDVQGAVALMVRRWPRWWLDLLLAVGTGALGILVLLNPFGTFATLVVLIGASLVYDGVSDLYLIWRLSRAFHELERMSGLLETEGRVEDE